MFWFIFFVGAPHSTEDISPTNSKCYSQHNTATRNRKEGLVRVYLVSFIYKYSVDIQLKKRGAGVFSPPPAGNGRSTSAAPYTLFLLSLSLSLQLEQQRGVGGVKASATNSESRIYSAGGETVGK